MPDASSWPPITDEALLERLIHAIRIAIASELEVDENGVLQLLGPDVANALMMHLAVILETDPSCKTPRGLRLLAEAAGKELLERMRDTRNLRAAEAITAGSLQ